jgi:hypothetical protein
MPLSVLIISVLNCRTQQQKYYIAFTSKKGRSKTKKGTYHGSAKKCNRTERISQTDSKNLCNDPHTNSINDKNIPEVLLPARKLQESGIHMTTHSKKYNCIS